VSSKANHTTSSAKPRKTGTKTNGVTSTARNGESHLSSLGVSIDKDFHAWLLEQGQAVREHRLEALDWENIAEELEGMARKEKHALTSHLRVMMIHLLKWTYQSTRRDRYLSSWRASILNSRQEIQDALEDSPSLGSKQNLTAFMQKAYRRARELAAAEMGLSDREMNRMFPAECPWTFEEFMTEGFLPRQREAARSSR
jgi:hypothetical protein